MRVSFGCVKAAVDSPVFLASVLDFRIVHLHGTS